MNPTQSVILFGTDEPAGERRVLTAGPLSAELDAGNLRYIRIGGKEALRGIAFLCRDRNWGTYNPEISELQISEEAGSFTVTYEAVCRDAEQAFRYSARIEGRADGSLVFTADGEALGDFVTNRTGFVVLHPLAGVSGRPVTVEHTDGRTVDSTFPERIDPACPFQDIRALTHEVAPGLRLRCVMEGDAFEMEDHRNWMDASYKTYVRPLALPWPYTVAGGEKLSQRVTLTLAGDLPRPAAGGTGEAVTVTVGEATGGRMPRVGLAAPAEHIAAARDAGALLRKAGPAFIVCRFEASKGDDATTMQGFAELAGALGAEPVLEAVVPCRDASGAPTGDLAVLDHDMTEIGRAAEGVAFPRVAVSPATDLKCTLPGSVFPPAPDWADLFAAARKTFPEAEVGGGMFSYFTELNRKRPPAGLLDFICHTGSPIVHAGDDVSVTETLEALPAIFASVRAFAGGKPYWIFPTAISMRDNPYGAAPAENPGNIRQAMNRTDPRERGLLGAAWYAGYLAHAARAGVEAVTLGACAGPSGIVHTRQEHAQPWFDSAGDGAVMPSYPVIAGHAALAGAGIRRTTVSSGREVQALAAEAKGKLTVWLSNLTGEPRTVRVEGVPGGASAAVLDAGTFAAACRNAGDLDDRPIDPGRVELAPYAVVRLRFG